MSCNETDKKITDADWMRSFSIDVDDANKSNKKRNDDLIAKRVPEVMTMSNPVIQTVRAKLLSTATGIARVTLLIVIVKRKTWVTAMTTHRAWAKPGLDRIIRSEIKPLLNSSLVQSTLQMAVLCTVYLLMYNMICNNCKSNKISITSTNFTCNNNNNSSKKERAEAPISNM